MLSPLMWAVVIRYPFLSFYLRVDKVFSFALNTFQYLLCVEHWQCVGDIILLFLWRQTANTCHIVWGHKCWLRNQFGYWNFSETFISLLPSIWEPIYLLDFIFFLLEDNRQNFLWGHTDMFQQNSLGGLQGQSRYILSRSLRSIIFSKGGREEPNEEQLTSLFTEFTDYNVAAFYSL